MVMAVSNPYVDEELEDCDDGDVFEEVDHPDPSFEHDGNLPWPRVIFYATGHFYNDLCACMWFSYLLLFMERVLGYGKVHAGILIFIGQMTDGLCTPLVGLGSDMLPLPKLFRRYGRRKTWHLLGTVCVTVTFPFIFRSCLFREIAAPNPISLVYYSFFIMLFQFGWAAVQISHLALIPELTESFSQRTTLNGLRYLFTVLASLSVYAIVYVALKCETDSKISSADRESYESISLVVVAVGCVFSACFHLGTKESKSCSRWYESLSRSNSISATSTRDAPPLKKLYWTDWLKEHQFYQVGLLYMCSRVYINISQIYYPFYIQYSQGFGKRFVAIFPPVVCVTGFLVSFIVSLQSINKYLDRKVSFLVGCLFAICGCVSLSFFDLHHLLYVVSVIMGIAQSVLLVTSLAITADLIGKNTESGAFVYGCVSFLDKLSNGIVCQTVQYLNENAKCVEPPEAHCRHFYRDVMVYVPGGTVTLAVIVMITVLPQKIGQRQEEVEKISRSRYTVPRDDEIVVS